MSGICKIIAKVHDTGFIAVAAKRECAHRGHTLENIESMDVIEHERPSTLTRQRSQELRLPFQQISGKISESK